MCKLTGDRRMDNSGSLLSGLLGDLHSFLQHVGAASDDTTNVRPFGENQDCCFYVAPPTFPLLLSPRRAVYRLELRTYEQTHITRLAIYFTRQTSEFHLLILKLYANNCGL